MILVALKSCQNDYETLHKTAHKLGEDMLSCVIDTAVKVSKLEGGRPVTDNEQIDISFSHTFSLSACAVSCRNTVKELNALNYDYLKEYNIATDKIGIDVELIDTSKKKENIQKIAERYFLPNELSFLNSSKDEKECYQNFFMLWTKKESICKMTGEGLSGFSKSDALHSQEYKTESEILEIDGVKYYLSICFKT